MTAEHWECTIQDYHKSPGTSNSKLSLLKESPSKYRAKYIAGTKDEKYSPCLKRGTLVHEKALLGVFTESTVVIPKEVLNKDGHRKGADWKAYETEHSDDGKIHATEKEMEEVGRYVSAVIRNPLAKQILEKSQREYSLRWDDPETGLLARCRFDCFGDKYNADLKTTTNVLPKKFSSSVWDYGYHRQAAMYSAGSELFRNGEIVPFLFIAVNEWDCVVHELDEWFDEQGKDEYRRLMNQLKYHEESGDWTIPNSLGRNVLQPARWMLNESEWEFAS